MTDKTLAIYRTRKPCVLAVGDLMIDRYR